MNVNKVLMYIFSHLDGTVLHSNGMVLDALTRPSLMITDALNAAVVHPPRKERYAALFGMYINTSSCQAYR